MDKSLLWDQRMTLCPPPYKGAMAQNLPGLTIGDEFVDKLSLSTVSPCHNAPRKHISASDQLPDPPWVNFDQVARGQALWITHSGANLLSLTGALLNGFSIARFAKVLSSLMARTYHQCSLLLSP